MCCQRVEKPLSGVIVARKKKSKPKAGRNPIFIRSIIENAGEAGQIPAAAMRQSKGGHTMRKRYNPPHRSRVVKTLLSEEEYADFTERLAPYGQCQLVKELSQRSGGCL